METETHHSSLPNGDKQRIFARLDEHGVAIAKLDSGLKSLTETTADGLANIGSRIEDIIGNQRASRPQLGVIATVIFSTCALIGGLAGFALKSSISPLQSEIDAHEKLTEVVDNFHDRRISDIEKRMQTRFSDADDAQNARIASNERVIQEFNRLMLQNYVSGSVGAATSRHEHTTPNP